MVATGATRWRAPSSGPAFVALWATAAAAGAALLTEATSIKPTLGIGVVAGTAVLLRGLRHPPAVLSILAVSLFLELVTVGGLTVTRALAPLALFVLVTELVRGRARVAFAPQLRWVVGYSLWAVASALWTTSIVGTNYMVQSLAIALVYMLCFAALPRSTDDVQRLVTTIGYAMIVIGSLSTLTFYGKIHLSLFLKAGRGSGGVGDPDFFAALLLAFLPLALVGASTATRTRHRVALHVAALVAIGAVLTSQSRGGAIGLVLVLLLLIAVPARALFGTRSRKLVALACIAGAATALIIHSPWAVLPRLETITGPPKNGNAAGSGRVEIWKAAEHSIRDHPLFGIGFGSFLYHSDYLMLNTPGVDLTYFYLRTPGSEAHNLYLGTWADLGLPGLTLYVGMMAAVARSLRRTARRAAAIGAEHIRRLANGLLVGLASWSVTSCFLSTETARAFWLILGLSLALARLVDQRAGVTG